MKRTSAFSLLSVLAYSAFVTFGTASSEAAGIVSIKYQITGGSVVVPPGSVVTGGMYTVEFSALGTFTLVLGPAILKSFSFRGSDTYVTYGDTIATAFSLMLNGEVAGIGTAGGRFNNAVSAFFSGPVGLHCSGGTCASAGFTQSVTRFYTLLVTAPGASITINPTTANVAGSYQFVGTGSGPDPMLVSLSGQEVSRIFVPEPSEYLMLAAGLGCLVVLYRVREARLA